MIKNQKKKIFKKLSVSKKKFNESKTIKKNTILSEFFIFMIEKKYD